MLSVERATMLLWFFQGIPRQARDDVLLCLCGKNRHPYSCGRP